MRDSWGRRPGEGGAEEISESISHQDISYIALVMDVWCEARGGETGQLVGNGEGMMGGVYKNGGGGGGVNLECTGISEISIIVVFI